MGYLISSLFVLIAFIKICINFNTIVDYLIVLILLLIGFIFVFVQMIFDLRKEIEYMKKYSR